MNANRPMNRPQTFSTVVKCATCGKALGMLSNVPAEKLFEESKKASRRAFCEGHTENANLDYPWKLDDARTAVPIKIATPEPVAEAEVIIIDEPEPAEDLAVTNADLDAAARGDAHAIAKVNGAIENGMSENPS